MREDKVKVVKCQYLEKQGERSIGILCTILIDFRFSGSLKLCGEEGQ